MGVRSVASPSCRRARWSGFSAAVSTLTSGGWGCPAVAYEVNADGRDIGLCVGVVGESQEQAGLADTGVADEQQLEEVVVSDRLLAAARGGACVSGGRRKGRHAIGGEDTIEEVECQRQTKAVGRRPSAGAVFEATYYSGFIVNDV